MLTACKNSDQNQTNKPSRLHSRGREFLPVQRLDPTLLQSRPLRRVGALSPPPRARLLQKRLGGCALLWPKLLLPFAAKRGAACGSEGSCRPRHCGFPRAADPGRAYQKTGAQVKPRERGRFCRIIFGGAVFGGEEAPLLRPPT